MRQRDSYHHGNLGEALLFAAIQSVRDVGAHKLSVRAVARELEVDVASVYRHYRNKQALLDAVVAHALQRMAAMMREELLAAEPSPGARLEAVGRGYILFALEEPALFQSAFGPHRGPPSQIGKEEGPYALLIEALEALSAAEQCIFPVDVATVIAWSAVHGLADLSISGVLTRAQAHVCIGPTLSVVRRGLNPA